MAGYYIDYSTVDSAVKSFYEANAEMNGIIKRMNYLVDQLEGWQGQAKQQYDQAQQRWDGAARDNNRMLQDRAMSLSKASDIYRNGDIDASQPFRGI